MTGTSTKPITLCDQDRNGVFDDFVVFEHEPFEIYEQHSGAIFGFVCTVVRCGGHTTRLLCSRIRVISCALFWPPFFQ